MAESENLLQKALYLGIGIAGMAVEKANETLQELQQQAEAITSYPDFAQKLQEMTDEMVNKGKINTEEARKFVEEMLQQQRISSSSNSDESSAPRTIEIIVDEDDDE